MGGVKERLTEFLRQEGVSKSEFGRRIGVSSAFISSMRKSIQPDKIIAIQREFPNLNTNWLLTGEGDMLKPQSNAVEIGGVISSSLNDTFVSQVDFIPVSAHATFIENLDQPESTVFEKMPVVLRPHERNDIASYKVFEIEGDSMMPRINDGALVLAKEIPEAQWHYAEGVVIVIFAEYVVIKRMEANRILTDNYIILASENERYGKMTVPLSDIRAIYKAKRIISSDI